jgi:glycosyltransferase involved in cell wall biosynthesis
MADTTVVVPCYNEAHRLPTEEFAAFIAGHREVGFVFVDDGSGDATGQRLRELARECPERCSVFALPENAGKAEAVRRGIGRVFETEAKYVGYWDADLSTPLGEIIPMRDALAADVKLEMVFGSRVRLLGRAIHRDAVRHYAGRVFATVVSLMLGIPVYDTQCGAKLLRASPLVRDLFAEPFVAKWVFDVEIIARLIDALGPDGRLRAQEMIAEHPLRAWRDVAGSKLRMSDFARAAADVVRIRQRYLAR